MNKKLLFTLIVGGAIALTGCNKKVAPFESSYFSVKPNPLEVTGNNVPGKITAKIPEKVFVKNAQVTVTPILNVNGQDIAGQPYTYQGEKVRGNSPVISYKNGGTFEIPFSYSYTPGMEDASLSLKFDVTQGKNQYALPTINVSKGVNTTATIADAATATPVIVPDKYQRVVSEKYSANINFLINKADVRDSEIASEGMMAFNQQIASASADSTRQIKEINIQSAASPEGGLEYNEKLDVGYRYYDKHPEEILYPFGHGLSYTSFEYSDIKVSQYNDGCKVSFKLKNTGDCDGAEVAQLYIADVVSTVVKPVKELKKFKKVFLKKGEETEVVFDLEKADFEYYNTSLHQWVAENGLYKILIGASSRDIRLEGNVVVDGDMPYTIAKVSEDMIG